MNTINKALLIVLFAITSCVPEQHNIKQFTPTPHVPTPTEGGTTISVYDYISAPDYKKECLNINPLIINSQAGFLDIYPGITTSQTIKETLGDPQKIIPAGIEVDWLYDNVGGNIFSIIIIGDIADRITAANLDGNTPSVKAIIEKYGCPSIIQKIDRSEHSAGNYDVIVFTYPEIGVEFWFDGIQVTLSSKPSETRYFKPISLTGYIQLYNRTLYVNSPMSSPVYWRDVVAEK